MKAIPSFLAVDFSKVNDNGCPLLVDSMLKCIARLTNTI